jgi:hypothetical protein
MTNRNNSRPVTPEQERGPLGKTRGVDARRGTSAAANAEDWGISSEIRDGPRGSACLGGGRDLECWIPDGIFRPSENF